MRQKYPRKVSDANEVAMLSPIEEMMLSFHLEDEVHELPACLTAVGNNPADPAVTNTAATGEDKAHREFLLRNRVGKTCLWKKYILLCECIQKQGKNNF